MPPSRTDDGIAAFAAAASTYEAWFTSPLRAFVDQHQGEALAGLLHGTPPGMVLDIGAGTGHNAVRLAHWGYHVTAVEPSPAMRRAGQRHTRALAIPWCAARAEALPFCSASVDGVVFFTTLEFVQDPGQALHEARRVVRRGGWLAVGFLHAYSPWAAFYRTRADQGVLPWTAARFWTRPEIEALLGLEAERSAAAVYLAPQAIPPFDAAEATGKRAGNAPALEILFWTTPR